MATVNKNFRVKNGLVVEGSTATVNGYDILTKSSSSQSYIIDLIGGQATSTNTPNAVVKRDANGDFAAGVITADLIGDVTGTVSSLSNHNTDDLSEGSSNLYFTNQRALDATASAYDTAGSASAAQAAAEDYTDTALLSYTPTANLDSTIDGYGYLKSADLSGYATESYVTGEINALDTDDIEEGTSNLYFTNQRALDATASAYDAAGSASTAQSNAATYTDNAINALDTDDIEEGSSNLYFTNGRARNAVSGGTGITYNPADGVISVTSNTYDSYGAASAAESNANAYTDGEITTALATAQGYADSAEADAISAAAADATTKANTAEQNAKDYADSLASNYDVAGAAATAEANANSYTDTAVANLVDGAPALLDTLNELAAAIADNPNYATDVANLVATKADTSYVDSEISDLDTAAQGYATTAENNAKAYADGLASNYDAAGSASAAQSAAESYADGLAGDILDGTSEFTALDINSVSRQVASTTGNIDTAVETTVLSWAKSSYRTAKVLLKAKNGSHTHASEVLLTLDTSDNINITEYAITTTNGSLMDITADISGTDVRIRVTPAHNNTEVMAHATLLV